MSNAYNNPQRPQVDYATEEHHISRDHPKSRSNIIVAASMATLNQSRQQLIIKIQRRVHSIQETGSTERQARPREGT